MTIDYDPYELKLAREIATALNDEDSLVMHLQYVRRYQEPHLRKCLMKALSIDERKIKRSRAALYTFLVTQGGGYGNSGH